MRFDPAEKLAEAVAHYAQLAMKPGFWAQAQHQVKVMEADQHAQGLWGGLHAQVAARVKAAGFKPAKDELGSWWDVPVLGMVPAPASNKRNWS